MKYRGYEVGNDEETPGKIDGIDAMFEDAHDCTAPITRKCWDCSFCHNRYACTEAVDVYGNPVKM